jgi:photosynthetic reaction center cytochrome c subunit
VGLAASRTTGSGLGSRPAGEVYKNIQVLKDLPADQLPATMASFTAALGVQCSYCHVSARDQDVKREKEMARKMLRMVRSLNTERIERRASDVTCESCHHGHPTPKKRSTS